MFAATLTAAIASKVRRIETCSLLRDWRSI
jgi:hypothetical protein